MKKGKNFFKEIEIGNLKESPPVKGEMSLLY